MMPNSDMPVALGYTARRNYAALAALRDSAPDVSGILNVLPPKFLAPANELRVLSGAAFDTQQGEVPPRPGTVVRLAKGQTLDS